MANLKYEKYNKPRRLQDTEWRNKERKKNYAVTRKFARGGPKRRWSLKDIEKIMDPSGPTDRDLAKELGRSVQAIHVKRAKCQEKFSQVSLSH